VVVEGAFVVVEEGAFVVVVEGAFVVVEVDATQAQRSPLGAVN